MKYLLDTNTCIRYINGRAPQIRERIRLIADTDITISTVTMGEMFFGSAKVSILNVPAPDRMLFFVRFAHLVFDESAANEFGRIRAHLEAAGTPIGPYDMQIAAIALVHGLIVVTHNTREFSRIPNLQIEDWEA
ncbi:MAG: type II toxin-antitoxin system VapC family toxin [Anaerolineaceae bacterium]|nr:type II toxin-antitoxin system VapC family toxin [Anaerolineaceae bacterium]